MQDYRLSVQSFSHNNVAVDRHLCIWRQKYWCRILLKNTWKNIADIHIITAYEKYCRYLRQYSKSIADTIGNNTSTAILTTRRRLCLVRYQCSGENWKFWASARTVDIWVIILQLLFALLDICMTNKLSYRHKSCIAKDQIRWTTLLL